MPKGKAKGAAVPHAVLSKHHKLLVDVIHNQTGLDHEDITLDSTHDDLGMDSLDFIECVMELEERLGIEIDEEPLSHLKNVREVVAALDKLVPEARPDDSNKT